MIEKRKHIRRGFRSKIICYLCKNPKTKTKAKSFNISLEGIGINLKKFIKGSEKLNLQICSPHSKSPINAKGKLIWQDLSPNPVRKQAGIQFTEIPWTKIKSLLR